jgi:hypothetical protein
VIKRALTICLAAAMGLALAGCGERAQTASGRKADSKASDGPGSAYTAAGWKPGDAASWEQQMRTRSQGQNEYARTSPK